MNSENYPPYFRPYIEKIPEGAPLELLALNLKETLSTLAMVSDEQANQAYAPGKWSIKDLVQHLIDTERIFCYRALSIARGESSSLLGYDHDTYVVEAKANHRSLKSLLEELKNLRTATIDLFRSLSQEMLEKEGNANGLAMTPQKLQYILIGHELHHRSILVERYL